MNFWSGSRADIDMLSAHDKLRFDNLISDYALNGKPDQGIGTYSEKSLHYILKNFFESNNDCHEVAYKGFVADVKHGSTIMEIQTNTLYGLNNKLDAFLEDSSVRLVFPIIRKRRIVWIDPETGDAKRCARSVVGESNYSLIPELLYIIDYLRDPSLTVTVVTLEADDYRMLDGKGRDRKKSATKVDLVPTAILDMKDMVFPNDLADFVPGVLGDVFLRQDFAKVTHLRGRSLWAVLKVLEEMRVITRVENDGRRHRYCRIITNNVE